MKYITYFIKFFYRIRYWLIIAPLLVAALVFWKTRHMLNNILPIVLSIPVLLQV